MREREKSIIREKAVSEYRMKVKWHDGLTVRYLQPKNRIKVSEQVGEKYGIDPKTIMAIVTT
jgi:hypothetical protein